MSEFLKKFNKLHEASGRKNISVANEIGVGADVFSHWLKGRTNPAPTVMRGLRLAKYYGVDPEWLFDESISADSSPVNVNRTLTGQEAAVYQKLAKMFAEAAKEAAAPAESTKLYSELKSYCELDGDPGTIEPPMTEDELDRREAQRDHEAAMDAERRAALKAQQGKNRTSGKAG